MADVIAEWDVRVAVGAQTGLGPDLFVAARLYLPAQPGRDDSVPLVVCGPGGTYSWAYYDLEVPLRPREDYSMAHYIAARGAAVLALDHLGTGRSSRPPISAAATAEIVAHANHLAADHAASEITARTGWTVSRVIGVGHSIGAMLVLVQQAAFSTYERIAVLGYPAVALSDDAQVGPPLDIQTLPEYAPPDRGPYKDLFFMPDVPADVVAADDALAIDVPRELAIRATARNACAAEAAAVSVPVFLGFGERDISPNPHLEPSAYPGASDITLFRLRGSGHCHNLASTRHLLWARLDEWIRSGA